MAAYSYIPQPSAREVHDDPAREAVRPYCLPGAAEARATVGRLRLSSAIL